MRKILSNPGRYLPTAKLAGWMLVLVIVIVGQCSETSSFSKMISKTMTSPHDAMHNARSRAQLGCRAHSFVPPRSIRRPSSSGFLLQRTQADV